MSQPASRRDIAIYLVAVTALSTASIATLAVLFFTGFAGLRDGPVTTTGSDPASIVLGLAGIALVLLLVAVVVVFGAKHGIAAETRDSYEP